MVLLTGTPEPLGATFASEGVNFAIFSKYAAEVNLLLFEQADQAPVQTIKLNRSGDMWHAFVPGLKAGQLYGYKIDGEYNPSQGKRFNPHKLLLDPYAKAVTGKFKDQDRVIFAYDVAAPEKDLKMDLRDTALVAPKAIVIDDQFDWGEDRRPQIPVEELIIYETHVKAMTAHPSSSVEAAGTYLGFVEKIPYLKELGINAVEFLPVHEFYIRTELLDKGLTDFWGYNTIGFFAPEFSYSTQAKPGCQVQEFKTLVKALHEAGIEVILDVVYNHTGEGSELGPTLCFKGIDNPTYYALVQNPQNPQEQYRYYLNDTGTGNTFNVEHPQVLRLILDSLKYWATIMRVDGFRFDLAPILARTNGLFDPQSPFFEAIAKDPVLSKLKMIAEPWDLTTYQMGHFPAGWLEWNGKFRDTSRSFIKGDEGQAPEMAKCLTGSAEIFPPPDKRSVNFIACHDGFTLHDVFAYNSKHNEANQEDNRDGLNDNHSWNCGVEGETTDAGILQLRKQMVKNGLCATLFSSGTPMLLYGDEVWRTQKGNNNAYCQDNARTWFHWEDLKKHADIFKFCQKAIAFRKSCGLLKPVSVISWYNQRLAPPLNWHNPRLKFLCYELADPDIGKDDFLFMVWNMNHRGTLVDLPPHENYRWFRLVDTAQKAGEDFFPSGEGRPLRRLRTHCQARSVSIFVGRRA